MDRIVLDPVQGAFAGNLLANGRQVLTTDGQVDKQDNPIKTLNS